jgi:homoserine dehydrogenase
MKTTILANTLLDGQLTPQMVEREGIRNLTTDDICSAALAGSPYRLVSEAHRKYGILTAEVRPSRINAEDILHIATGMTGVISLETAAMGTITLVEHAPTVSQTAYGVLSDLITEEAGLLGSLCERQPWIETRHSFGGHQQHLFDHLLCRWHSFQEKVLPILQ